MKILSLKPATLMVAARVLSVSFMIGISSFSVIAAPTSDADTRLSLEEAINLALSQSPRTKGATATVEVARGDRLQAEALPNPELSVEVENIAGSGPYKGFDSAETTAQISQQIEIGGKRSARKAVADKSVDMASLDQSVMVFDITREVKIAFANAVSTQEEVRLTSQQVALAEDILKTVRQRVGAAAEPQIQENKARVALSSAKLNLEKAKRTQQSALKKLSLLWGETGSLPPLDTKSFYAAKEPEDLQTLLSRLEKGIEFRRNSLHMEKAKSNFELEQANAVPDPTFNVGVRDFREDNEQALLVGVSIPLPVFNRNSGNIEKARHEIVRADSERMNGFLTNQAALHEYYQNQQTAFTQIKQIKEEILPETEQAFAQAKRGYNAGKFAYLEVLDAQRTLAETRMSYVSALKDYHINQAEIERLTATIEQTVAGSQP